MLKRIVGSLAARRFAGRMLARYLKLVHRTSSLVLEPADIYDRVRPHLPVIIAMWHGQHFMVPLARPPWMPARVMISRSGDGEINAVAAERLGLATIRASGGRTAAQMRRRGGARGFLESLRALEEGDSLALTADVPKGPARVAGAGIVLLAQKSGRPILPVAYASSRRVTVRSSWDQASVNLPFSRAAVVVGEPIRVPAEATEAEVEHWRAVVKDGLDRATARAYAIVDRRDG